MRSTGFVVFISAFFHIPIFRSIFWKKSVAGKNSPCSLPTRYIFGTVIVNRVAQANCKTRVQNQMKNGNRINSMHDNREQ